MIQAITIGRMSTGSRRRPPYRVPFLAKSSGPQRRCPRRSVVTPSRYRLRCRVQQQSSREIIRIEYYYTYSVYTALARSRVRHYVKQFEVKIKIVQYSPSRLCRIIFPALDIICVPALRKSLVASSVASTRYWRRFPHRNFAPTAAPQLFRLYNVWRAQRYIRDDCHRSTILQECLHCARNRNSAVLGKLTLRWFKFLISTGSSFFVINHAASGKHITSPHVTRVL